MQVVFSVYYVDSTDKRYNYGTYATYGEAEAMIKGKLDVPNQVSYHRFQIDKFYCSDSLAAQLVLPRPATG